MPRSLTSDDIRGPGAPPGDDGGDFGGGGDAHDRGSSRRASLTGLIVLLASTIMVFGAFTIAFALWHGYSTSWHGIRLPRVLWANTGVLLASGAALEYARRALRAGKRARFDWLWTAGAVLGILFLLGQILAWRQLQSAGVFVATNPASAFFYVLSATHAAHVLAGLAALIYVDVQALTLRLGPAKRTAVELSTWFWHFLDAVWLFLMILFVVWG